MGGGVVLRNQVPFCFSSVLPAIQVSPSRANKKTFDNDPTSTRNTYALSYILSSICHKDLIHWHQLKQQSDILAVSVYWVGGPYGCKRMIAQSMMWDQSMIWEPSRLVTKDRKLVETNLGGGGVGGGLLLVRAVQHV